MFKIYFSDMAQLYYLDYIGNYSDWAIAKKMNVKLSKYRSILVKSNAIRKYDTTYFENINDAQGAIEKLESIVIANKLEGKLWIFIWLQLMMADIF